MQYSTHGRPEITADSAERIVETFEAREVADHPLFIALRAQPVNLSALWILMANLQAGISKPFIVWLARAIAHVDDPRIASLICKQLNDELGNGEFDQIHSVMLTRFVDALETWRPSTADASILAPGRRLADAGDVLFDDDAYFMVGAIMTGEIFAKKMDQCLGDEVRRQSLVEPEALRWLVLHEALEVDHASDSLGLARLVPVTGSFLRAAQRGAYAQWDMLWGFLDDVHVEVQRARIGAFS
jgi:pyrroloquinoline quinone (PQQ) biosynthesis protein C